MNKPSESLGLRSPDGREAQLLSVQVHGEVLGLMLRLTVRQTWRNTSGAPMATRLTFALAPDQCLLDMQALRSNGPQPVSAISRQDREVCSAAFGVMNTGEQFTVQWRIGQLLHLQGGSLRLNLPAHCLPPALRPGKLSLEVHDPVARGTLGSTSHEVQRARHANGMTCQLSLPHGLDRDFGLSVHGLRETGMALASPDPAVPGQFTLLGSHSLQLARAQAPQRLRLKLLMDHTGALGADRQSQVQSALDRLLASLQPGDQLSYSRVGNTLSHELPRLQPCAPAYLRRARALLRHTDTEAAPADWAAILQAVIEIRDEDEEAVTDTSILLVTALPITAIAGPLQALRAAGHRLHVMTVGAAAGDSLWPVLANASGGSSEALGPGQHSQQALQRLFERMRSLRPVQAQLLVEGQALEDAKPEHTSMAEGDTLHLWAPFVPTTAQVDLTGRPLWTAQLSWQAIDETSGTRRADDIRVLWDAEGDLTRVCAARQAQRMAAGPERDALMARHRLLLPDEPRSGATAGSATSSRPVELPQNAAQPTAPSATVLPLQAAVTRRAPSASPTAALVQQFNQQAPAYRQFRAALSATLQRVSTRTVDGLVMQLARKTGNPGRVWALLLHWLHAEHELTLEAQALHLVEQELASVPVALRAEVHQALALAAIGEATARAA